MTRNSRFSIVNSREKHTDFPDVKDLLISFFLITQFSLLAQSDHTQQIASGISRYRAFLLESKVIERQQLGIVLKKLESLNIPEEERGNLGAHLGRLSRHNSGIDPIVLCRERSKHFGKTYVDSLTDAELDIILRNTDIYDLAQIGVLELDYPFKVRSEFNLQRELFFYNVRNGEQIGEVGAGNGEFSALLAMIYDSLNLFVNEINPNSVSYIERKFQRLDSLIRTESVEIVVGEQTKTNFNSTSFDKIIMRNAFHHFENKRGMMTSIKNSLSDDGLLFLKEKTLELEDNTPCPLTLRERQILRYIERAGFELVDIIQIERALYFKFRIRGKEKKKEV